MPTPANIGAIVYLTYIIHRSRYWSDLVDASSGALATAAVFGGESARVIGKRDGAWLPARKLTWERWQAGGQDTASVLLPQGQHPFANEDWSSTLNVQLKPQVKVLADRIGFAEIDTSTSGIRPPPVGRPR